MYRFFFNICMQVTSETANTCMSHTLKSVDAGPFLVCHLPNASVYACVLLSRCSVEGPMQYWSPCAGADTDEGLYSDH